MFFYFAKIIFTKNNSNIFTIFSLKKTSKLFLKLALKKGFNAFFIENADKHKAHTFVQSL